MFFWLSLRFNDSVKNLELKQCLKSIAGSTTVHKHLIKAHLGKCSLRTNLSPQTLTQTTTMYAPSCTPISGCSSSHAASFEPVQFPINLRLRMPTARRNKLLQAGHSIGSGPLYNLTNRTASTSTVQSGLVENHSDGDPHVQFEESSSLGAGFSQHNPGPILGSLTDSGLSAVRSD